MIVSYDVIESTTVNLMSQINGANDSRQMSSYHLLAKQLLQHAATNEMRCTEMPVSCSLVKTNTPTVTAQRCGLVTCRSLAGVYGWRMFRQTDG